MSQPQPNPSSLMYQQHGATAVPTASLGPVLYTAGPVHTTTLRTVQSSPPYIPASTTSQPPPPFASPGFPLSSDQATFLQQQQQHHPVLEISQDYRNAFFSVNTAFSSQQMPAVAVPPSPSQQTASAFPSAPAAHTSQATVVGVATDAVATTVPFAGIRLYRPSADRPGPTPQPTTRMASSPPLHTRDKGYACQLYALHGNCPYRNCPFMHIKGGERRSLPHAVCIYYMQDRCLREECKYFHGNPTRLHRLHAMGEKDYCPLDNMPSFNPSVPPTEPDGEIPAAVRTGAVPPRETPPQVPAAPVVAVLPPQPPTAPAPYTGALAYSAAFQPTTSVPYSTPHSVMMTVQPQPVHSSHGVMWSTPGQYTPWTPPNNLPTLPFSPTPPPPPHPSSSSLTTHPQTTYVVLTPYDAWPLR